MPNTKYETNAGTIVRIRLSEEKIALAGAAPAGAIDQPGWSISVSASTRSQNKRKAGGAIYSRTIPTTEPGVSLVKYYFFPQLTPATRNGTQPLTIPYLGNTLDFVNISPEG